MNFLFRVIWYFHWAACGDDGEGGSINVATVNGAVRVRESFLAEAVAKAHEADGDDNYLGAHVVVRFPIPVLCALSLRGGYADDDEGGVINSAIVNRTVEKSFRGKGWDVRAPGQRVGDVAFP